MHDLDAIAGLQDVPGMAAARDDLAIDLDRDPAFAQAFGCQQGAQGGPGREVTFLAVEVDLHPVIVAGPPRIRIRCFHPHLEHEPHS